LDSFNKALEQVNADKDYINLNLAILYNRWGKLDNAKATIDKVSSGSYNIRKLRVQLSILLDKQHYQEIIENISNNKVLLKNTPIEEYSELSLILYFYSYALWKTDSIEKANETIKEALFYDRLNNDAYWLIREIYNDFSSNNKYFRILITGDWLGEDDKDKKYGFYSSYDIVADSEQKAIDLIKEFETAPIDKDSVKIDEIEEIKFNTNENPSGIYNVHGFSIFDSEE
jgi:tetratricopeptide (TPR) repeat protein